MLIRLSDLTVSISAPEKVLSYFRDYEIRDRQEAFGEPVHPDLEITGTDVLDIHRQAAEALPHFRRLVCHGAVIEAFGKGILFTAPSGTGKTTHILNWQKVFGKNVRVINGDKPILSAGVAGSGEKPEVTVFGTPWMGKERMGENTSVRLDALVLLERGKENRIRKTDPAESLERLMQQIYIPADRSAADETYALTEMILRSVPFYILECTPDERSAEEARRGIFGN